MIGSPHDTATTVFLARGAVRVETMISAELFTFTPDTLLEEARDKAPRRGILCSRSWTRSRRWWGCSQRAIF